MRVVTLVGSKAGEVIDLPPLSARAMLADGRARPVDDAPSVIVEQVASRSDRGMPTGKRRSTR